MRKCLTGIWACPAETVCTGGNSLHIQAAIYGSSGAAPVIFPWHILRPRIHGPLLSGAADTSIAGKKIEAQKMIRIMTTADFIRSICFARLCKALIMIIIL